MPIPILYEDDEGPPKSNKRTKKKAGEKPARMKDGRLHPSIPEHPINRPLAKLLEIPRAQSPRRPA